MSVVVVSIKIARPGDLGIWATRKYNISVDVVEKLASLCFESFGKAHERRKYFILLATPMDTTHYVLSAHAHNRSQYIGKGRHQAAGMELFDIDVAAGTGYMLYRALVIIP